MSSAALGQAIAGVMSDLIVHPVAERNVPSQEVKQRVRDESGSPGSQWEHIAHDISDQAFSFPVTARLYT